MIGPPSAATVRRIARPSPSAKLPIVHIEIAPARPTVVPLRLTENASTDLRVSASTSMPSVARTSAPPAMKAATSLRMIPTSADAPIATVVLTTPAPPAEKMSTSFAATTTTSWSPSAPARWLIWASPMNAVVSESTIVTEAAPTSATVAAPAPAMLTLTMLSSENACTTTPWTVCVGKAPSTGTSPS